MRKLPRPMTSDQHAAESRAAHIYIDGGSRGNPGPSAIAYIIKSPDEKDVIASNAKFIGETTNNVAEYTALLYGLKRAAGLGIKRVFVHSDSQLLVGQMMRSMKVRSAHIYRLHSACQRAAEEFEAFGIEHIPRTDNIEADKMVQGVIKAQKAKDKTVLSKCNFDAEAFVYVNGNSKTSPGPAAAGYIVVSAQEQVLASNVKYLGERDRNVACYAGVYLSAQKARQLGLKRVVFRSDSSLVMRQLAGEYRVKSPVLMKPHGSCTEVLKGFEKLCFETVSRAENKVVRSMVLQELKAHAAESSDAREEQGTSTHS